MLENILMVSFLVVALFLVGVILLQQGKGAGMGASFGAGASNTVFGASGAGNTLTKITTILAVIFFAIALFMSSRYMTGTDAPVAVDEDIWAEDEPAATPANDSEIPSEPEMVVDEFPAETIEAEQDSDIPAEPTLDEPAANDENAAPATQATDEPEPKGDQ